MRLDINLASQPYEDARQFWMRWGPAAGVLGLLTLILLTLDITGWVEARRDRAAINRAKTTIAQRDAVRANAEQILNLPKNRTTRDESQFLNQLIERKSFSWTQVLENLEKVMPPRVHLVSISPALDEDNQLELKMIVAGDSRDRAVELERRMEDSRRFAQTYIVREAHMESQTGDSEQVEIAAVYVPEEPSAVGTTEATTPAKSGTAPKRTPKQPTPKAQTQVARRSKP
jgi:Tfp pilus assembly protein PilN